MSLELSLELSLESFPLSLPWELEVAGAGAGAVGAPATLPVAVAVVGPTLALALWEAAAIAVDCSLPLLVAVDCSLPLLVAVVGCAMLLMPLPVADALGIIVLEPIARLEVKLVMDEAAPPLLLSEKGAPAGGLPSSVTKN